MDDFWSIKIKLLLESYHDTWSLIKFTYFMIYLKSQMISIFKTKYCLIYWHLFVWNSLTTLNNSIMEIFIDQTVKQVLFS